MDLWTIDVDVKPHARMRRWLRGMDCLTYSKNDFVEHPFGINSCGAWFDIVDHTSVMKMTLPWENAPSSKQLSLNDLIVSFIHHSLKLRQGYLHHCNHYFGHKNTFLLSLSFLLTINTLLAESFNSLSKVFKVMQNNLWRGFANWRKS